MANIRQKLGYLGVAGAIGVGGVLAAERTGLADKVREMAPHVYNVTSADSGLAKAIENASYRESYVNSRSAEKPSNVEFVYYDHGSRAAKTSAERSAMVVSTRYFQRFGEEGIEKELAELLKNAGCYETLSREAVEKDIQNHLNSNKGRKALAALIEDYVGSEIINHIKTADAVAILVAYDGPELKTAKYKVFVLDSAFEAKDGEQPTAGDIDDLLKKQFDFAKKGLIIPR